MTFERRRLRVYVAGPMSHGDVFDNMVRGMKVGRRMVRDGLAPYIPHLDLFLMGAAYVETNTETLGWNAALEWDIEWVASSDALYRLSGASKGADLECRVAEELGIPVFYEEYVTPYTPVLEPRRSVDIGYVKLLEYATENNLAGKREAHA